MLAQSRELQGISRLRANPFPDFMVSGIMGFNQKLHLWRHPEHPRERTPEIQETFEIERLVALIEVGQSCLWNQMSRMSMSMSVTVSCVSPTCAFAAGSQIQTHSSYLCAYGLPQTPFCSIHLVLVKRHAPESHCPPAPKRGSARKHARFRAGRHCPHNPCLICKRAPYLSPPGTHSHLHARTRTTIHNFLLCSFDRPRRMVGIWDGGLLRPEQISSCAVLLIFVPLRVKTA